MITKVPQYRRGHVTVSNDGSFRPKVEFCFSRSEAEWREEGTTSNIMVLPSSRTEEGKLNHELYCQRFEQDGALQWRRPDVWSILSNLSVEFNLNVLKKLRNKWLEFSFISLWCQCNAKERKKFTSERPANSLPHETITVSSRRKKERKKESR